jgi:hypothetical protein
MIIPMLKTWVYQGIVRLKFIKILLNIGILQLKFGPKKTSSTFLHGKGRWGNELT